MSGADLDQTYWALESAPADAKRWYEIGCKLMRQASTSEVELNPFDRAAARYALRAAVELEPQDAEICSELGRMLESCGELEAASRAFIRAAALDPRPLPCERAAALLARLGRGEEVERWAGEGLVRAKSRGAPAATLTSFANSLLRVGRSRQAVELLEQVVAEHPEDPQALFNLAVALRRAEFHDRSVAVARRAVELVPDMPDAYLVLGRSLEAARDREGARRAYQQAIDRGASTVAAQAAAARLERLDRGVLVTDSGSFSGRGGDGTFSGDLVVLAVPELLEVLRIQSASGELYLWREARGIRLQLMRGRIVAATAPDGTRLTAPSDLDDPSARPFIEIMGELVRWNAGHFEFMRTAPTGDGSAGLDIQFLLMEAMRELDESSRDLVP